MRKVLSIAVLAVSCSGIESVSPVRDGENMTLVARIEATKTTNNGLSTLWSPADKASLIHCQSGNTTYYSSCFSYGENNRFTGTVSNKSEVNNWYFSYPYSSDNIAPNDIKIRVNPEPEQIGNNSTAHLCGEYFPIFGVCTNVASSDSVELSVRNALAVAKIVVTNILDEAITVSKIKFCSSREISGDFSADLTSADPVWTPKQGADSTVTLTVTDGTAIASGESAVFYLGFIPHSSSRISVTVTARTAGGNNLKYYSSKENSELFKFKSGLFKTVRLNFDDSHPVPVHYVKVTESMSDWSGAYLFVNETESKAFAALPGVANYSADVDITGGKIVSDGSVDRYVLNVKATGKGHPAISNSSSYDVCNCDGKYVYWSSNMGGVVLDDNNIYENHPSSDTDIQYGHCFEYSGGGVKVMAAGFKSGFTKYYLNCSSGTFSYSKTSGTVQLYRLSGAIRKQQSLKFPSDTIIIRIGTEHLLNGSIDVQQVEGAKSSVTYTSSNPDVAIISGRRITLKGSGTATITATANTDDEYCSASASYTLKITREGVFNLENPSVLDYLDAARQQYTDENYKTTTIVTQYCGGQSSTNRKDSPAPVTLSWTSSGSGTSTVNIYNDASMTDLEMSVSTMSGSVDIRNLIPGRTYWYSISTNSEPVTSGSFETEGRRRMLLVSDIRAKGHANNCRDLGGLKTTDGMQLKYGIIFRGSNVDMTSDAEKSILTDYMNVGIDIDLRSDTASYTSEGEDGIATANNPWTGSWSEKMIYCNDGAFSGTFSSSFKVGLTSSNAGFTKMFTKLLDTIRDNKSAYIHCHVGADRTGYVCMILELLLGVSPKDCSTDFELTSFSITGNRLRTGDSSHNMFKDAMNYINDYSGKTYQEKAYNILTGYGITDAQIQEFKEIMLERP